MLIHYPAFVFRTVLALCAIFLFSTSSFSQALTTAAEICDNGLDDDGDGLIDVYDISDCSGIMLASCTDTVLLTNFDIQLAWAADQNLRVTQDATPIVGNLNPTQDDIPEVVLVNNPLLGAVTNVEIFIFKGDGSNRSNPNRLSVPQGIVTDGVLAASLTIADLDNDNDPELIVLCADKRIRIYHGFNPAATPCMNLWITSADTCQNSQFDVYAADFNNDGISELYAGNEVYVLDLSVPGAPALHRRLRANGPSGRAYWNGFTPLGKSSSYAADLLSVADCNGDPDCEGLEIAAGYVIYSVDIDPNDGDGYQIKAQRNLNTMSGQTFFDGVTTVADVNLDNIPEVLVTSRKGADKGFYVWNKTGYSFFFPSDDFTAGFGVRTGSKVVVGNVYDDRQAGFAQDFPEMLVLDETIFYCLNLNRASVAPSTPYWWQHGLPNVPNGISTPSLFDFDLDGRPEILVKSTTLISNQFHYNLAVLYGGAAPFPAGVGANRYRMLYKDYIASGVPLVADVDADGQAEIVNVGCSNYHNVSPYYQLHVLEAEEKTHSTWPSARRVWNQENYTIVNVNDDLSIPKNQQPGHLEIPGPGSDFRPLNIVNGQLPFYGYQHPQYLTTADASAEVLDVICIGNLQFRVRVRVCNEGLVALPATLPLTFYRNGNPITNTGTPTVISTHSVSSTPIEPGTCTEFTVVLPYNFGDLYAVVNDPAIGVLPLQNSDQFWKAECDYSNNYSIFRTKGTVGPPLSLGPDINDCSNVAHVLQASPGFSTYTWQNGAGGQFFNAPGPGTYWVVATDFCSNTRRDTILIIADTVLQNLSVNICSGNAYTFNGVDVPAGTSQAFTYSTSTGCDSTIVVTVTSSSIDETSETLRICPSDSVLVFGNMIGVAGEYSEQYLNSFGCDSLHTITVELYTPPIPTSETREICLGDSSIVFGNAVYAAGVFSQNFQNVNGCDSLHSITVNVLLATATSEVREICPGESTLVFGNPVQTAGEYSQTFSSVNGCDSLHTVSVSLLPAPVPTSETRQLCPGDSTLVFGTAVYAAGVFAQKFSGVNGCDSTHTVTVSLLPAPVHANEFRQICAGDSTLVFGTIVHAAGTFTQSFSNVNGCDSLHTVTVNLFDAPLPTSEMRQICEGDSTLVFGTAVYAAGEFTQSFSGQNGCDSLHTISVSLFAAPVPTSEIRQICEGDSTLVFGTAVYAAGEFAQHFFSVNGCDSLHTITVNLYPAPLPTQETLMICAGDSVLVFGNYESAAGEYVAHFAGLNGCDSIHTVNINFLPGPVPTSEMRQLCAGDSTEVFGQFVSAAGVYVRHFPGAGGCDSLNTVTVNVFAAPLPTNETRQLCPGDSTLVSGSYVHIAGNYVEHFSAANGCDSLHHVNVSFFSASIPTQETRQICPGDSTLVFGTAVYAAGTFTEMLSNALGCDSVHTVTVTLFAAPVATSEIRQLCPGDSTLISGSYVYAPGLYNQTFTSVNGCDSLHSIEVTEAFLLEQHDTLALCPGDSVLLFGNWVHAPGIVQQIVPGTAGCDTLFTVTISEVEVPVMVPVVTQPDAQHAEGSVSVVAATGALYSLNAQNFTSHTVFDQLAPGDYVLYQQFEGCVQSWPFRIEAFIQPKADAVYAPNAIRPGSVNGNDLFTLYAGTDVVEVLFLRLYDRWGSLLFERRKFAPNDPSNGWDGLINGKPAVPGVYVWEAMIQLKDGDRVVKKGDVTVLR